MFTMRAVYCDGTGTRAVVRTVVTFGFALWAARCEVQSGATQACVKRADGTYLYSCLDGREYFYGRKVPVCGAC